MAALRGRLAGAAADLNEDELEVLVLVAEGLGQGRGEHGPLNIRTDQRDFALEALEEFRDAAVYLAAAMIKIERCPIGAWCPARNRKPLR
jgi:hypothetical protein